MRFLVIERDSHKRRGYISEGYDLLSNHGSIDLVHQTDGNSEQALTQLRELLPEADAVVIGPWYRPATKPEDWLQAKNMKVLAGTFDNRFAGWLDFEGLKSRGIPVIDTSRSMTPSVAEFALAMTLNLIRDIPESLYLVREGGWRHQPWDKPRFIHADLTGRSVGLAGFGSINRRYAELIAPFRCSVKTYDPFVSDDALQQYGVSRAESLTDLAQSSEVFVVGLPPTPTTQEALWNRIQAGEIAAAIDVFAPEPPPEDAWFRKHPNVLATPHIAGGTDFCNRRCFTDACKDAIAILTGGKPRFQATTWDDDCYQGRLT